MPKQKSNIIAALDLGTSKVACFIGRIGLQGKIEVLGVGYHASQGIRAGIITDIKATEKSIISAVSEAEKIAGEHIQKVYIAISSNNLLSQRISSEVLVTGNEINEKVLNKLLFQALDRYRDQEVEVLHSFPYDYMLDGNRGIISPLGMYGNKLSCDFHIISCQSSILLNIANCAARCQLEVEGYISSSYASGIACFTEDEMEMGITLLDLGGSCSAISVFHKGHLIFTDGIPLGGIHITSDLAKGLGIDLINAERIKNLYGGVISDDFTGKEMIDLSDMQQDIEEQTNVSRNTIVNIIRARVEEILEILEHKLHESRVAKFGGNKLVITGGVAQLTNIKDVVSEIFGKNTRIGRHIILPGVNELANSPSFTSIIGMLCYISEAKSIADPYGLKNSKQEGAMKYLMRWLKQNFA